MTPRFDWTPASEPTDDIWIKFDPLSEGYICRDGTFVAAEVAENCYTLADVFYIADIRTSQRRDVEPPKV